MKQKISYEVVQVELSEDLKTNYNLEDAQIVKIQIINGLYIIFYKFKKEATLVKNWDNLNSVVAAELSSTFENDYERWNLYSFYLCERSVKPSVKYKIEHDKYFSRKIVLGKFESNLDGDSISSLVSKYIINDDLVIKDVEYVDLSYSSESIVYGLIESEKTSNKHEIESLYLKLLSMLREKSNIGEVSNED